MIIINGKTFKGNNLTMRDNQIYIDGVRQEEMEDKIINITVNGDLENLTVDNANSVEVNGNVGYVTTANGDVTCTVIDNNVTTSNGDVTATEIRGNVRTVNGDISKSFKV